ncbi:ImmA/IrrE family metallo-endopeptidase [Streptomyces sp. NPDC059278]|uniref:ImmA/IrrE family metallo-endopeptidase n=1 Tax=Streptomyces sp. NPDC059278 TaxID=3346801 RepID=UPI0036CCE23C
MRSLSLAPVSAASVDAFSTRAARPLVVLTAARADDIYRHRFTAAHELGHLVLHADATGDSRQEKQADAFAAEFLTPRTASCRSCRGEWILHAWPSSGESGESPSTRSSTDAASWG